MCITKHLWLAHTIHGWNDQHLNNSSPSQRQAGPVVAAAALPPRQVRLAPVAGVREVEIEVIILAWTVANGPD